MKKGSVFGLFTAALMTFYTAASVCAADYKTKPDYPLPEKPAAAYSGGGSAAGYTPSGKGGTTSSVPSAGNGQKPSAQKPAAPAVSANISVQAVSEALESGGSITAPSYNADLKSSGLAALARLNGAVLNIVTPKFSVKIRSVTVTEAKDINLGLKFTKDANMGALIIRTVQKGYYGCTVQYSIPYKVYSQAGVNTETAALYIVEKGKAVKYSNINTDENGNIVFEIEEGGKFIVI